MVLINERRVYIENKIERIKELTKQLNEYRNE